MSFDQVDELRELIVSVTVKAFLRLKDEFLEAFGSSEASQNMWDPAIASIWFEKIVW